MTETLTLEKEKLTMYAATENLENDHASILRLLGVMEQMILNVSTNVTHMEMVVNLIRNFTDGYHHAKEERLLFPLLVKKGFSFQQGPVAFMMKEHNQGRSFVKGMVEGIGEYKAGNKSALPKIYHNMQEYIDLLRIHINKENNVLFRMADRMLSTEEQMEMLGEFEKLEAREYGENKIAQYQDDISGLEIVYGLTESVK